MSLKKGNLFDAVEKVATIVLAGGQGTRLFPLTATRCKPSVAFGGRYRLIDIPISNSLNARINQIFIISQYFASELNQHILSTYHLERFQSGGGIELLTPQETAQGKNWFKGTADAVRQNLDFITKNNDEYFLILSGDQLYNMDLLKMIDLAKKENADLVISSLLVEEEDAKRMGLLKLNKSNQVVDFAEKPQDPQILSAFKFHDERHWLGSMGIYIFKRAALLNILQEEGDDFGKHLIPKFIKKSRTFAFTYNGYWEDIGTIQSYYRANLMLTEKHPGLNTYDLQNPIYSAPQHVPSPLIDGTLIKNSLISQGSIIEAQEISHSVIGLRSIIKKKTIIKDSILIGNRYYFPFSPEGILSSKEYSIGENCLIKQAIIDEHTYIGNDVQLINKKNIQNMDGDGVFIRDGIIIVTPGTTLPDGYTL